GTDGADAGAEPPPPRWFSGCNTEQPPDAAPSNINIDHSPTKLAPVRSAQFRRGLAGTAWAQASKPMAIDSIQAPQSNRLRVPGRNRFSIITAMPTIR